MEGRASIRAEPALERSEGFPALKVSSYFPGNLKHALKSLFFIAIFFRP